MHRRLITAQDALIDLQEGNYRYASQTQELRVRRDALRREQTKDGQEPIAVILTCSDSRVPPALIFDQGPGDLFVVRIAGSIAGQSQLETIEFALYQLHTPLVVVMGHRGCGAVRAAMDHLSHGPSHALGSLPSIVGRITPALRPIMPEARGAASADSRAEEEALYLRAVRANTEHWTEVVSKHPSVAPFVERGVLLVVGAEYCLESGKVEFYGPPA